VLAYDAIIAGEHTRVAYRRIGLQIGLLGTTATCPAPARSQECHRRFTEPTGTGLRKTERQPSKIEPWHGSVVNGPPGEEAYPSQETRLSFVL